MEHWAGAQDTWTSFPAVSLICRVTLGYHCKMTLKFSKSMNEKCCVGTRLFCHLPTALTCNPMSQLAFLSQLAYSPNPTKSSLWKGLLIEQSCLQEMRPKEMCEARSMLLPGFFYRVKIHDTN